VSLCSSVKTMDISDRYAASIFKVDFEDGGKRSVHPWPLYIVIFCFSFPTSANDSGAQEIIVSIIYLSLFTIFYGSTATLRFEYKS
jgi:hypothetical protein